MKNVRGLNSLTNKQLVDLGYISVQTFCMFRPRSAQINLFPVVFISLLWLDPHIQMQEAM